MCIFFNSNAASFVQVQHRGVVAEPKVGNQRELGVEEESYQGRDKPVARSQSLENNA